ncbi:MAG: hypothetical protein ACREH3_09560 [Geminicoccales bacterium]
MFSTTRMAHSSAKRRPRRNVEHSGNWRITFSIEDETVVDLHLEDYH